jgi:hypothetical protein
MNKLSRDFIQGVHRCRFWISANAIGILAYLCFAALTWAPKSQANLPGGPGDPFIWAFGAFPVLVSFAIINLVWLGFVLTGLFRRSDWFAFINWLWILTLWYGAVLLDRSMHPVG